MKRLSVCGGMGTPITRRHMLSLLTDFIEALRASEVSHACAFLCAFYFFSGARTMELVSTNGDWALTEGQVFGAVFADASRESAFANLSK